MDYTKAVVEEQRDYQQKLLNSLEESMATMPDSFLVSKKVGGRLYYYEHRKGVKRKYLSIKKNAKLIVLLQQKAIFRKNMIALKHNLEVLKRFISSYEELGVSECLVDELCMNDARLKTALKKVISQGLFGAVNIEAWENAPYDSNPLYPEALMHMSIKGRRLRSKSELSIANMLDLMNIPYRYEEKLVLGDQVFYPDFVIKRPRDGKIIYWEHFGMIGNENYEKNMESKLKIYKRNGIVMWDNLILTFDSEDGVLDSRNIAGVIQGFLQ